MSERDVRYNPRQDYYEILGIPDSADQDTIQRAFHQLAKLHHPDLNKEEASKERFQLINDAYSVLHEQRLKDIYDMQRWPYIMRQMGKGVEHQEFRPPPTITQLRRERTPSYQRPIEPIVMPGEWLNHYGLGAARPLYVAFVNIMATPYRYIVILLGAAVLINALVILAGVFISASGEDNTTIDAAIPQNTDDSIASSVIPTQTLAPTVTPIPSQAINDCGEYIDIYSPRLGSVIYTEDLPLAIVGRLNHPDMFTYQVEAILADRSLAASVFLRPPSLERDNAVINQPIAWLTPLTYRISGRYEIRVTVFAADQSILGTCSLIIYRA
ncbi:MAG: J domain-containing protein [Anaerolineales bacterium]|nr:J domain-containing protein [Anaerolineales bacterium]